jgi:deoxyribodipyrimidine photo-lyase
MSQRKAIYWLKKDLRTEDNQVLQFASDHNLEIDWVFLIEPNWKQQPTFDYRHLNFALQSIYDISMTTGHIVKVVECDAIDFWQKVLSSNQFEFILSHEETGLEYSFERDKQCAKLFKENDVVWKEFPSNGVQRGRVNRDGWMSDWYKHVSEPILRYDKRISWSNLLGPRQALQDINSGLFQKGGENEGHRIMKSFFEGRYLNYTRGISKPFQSRDSCSRLSPYLAWGNISIRQVYQSAEMARKANPLGAFPLKSFQERLRWHCHFIQKFEMECSQEHEPINKAFDKIVYSWNEKNHKAWVKGRTGYPLVDACMRCLKETGYINFRMRAMLISFYCFVLGHHWKEGSKMLARFFLDFEPGIHYPQIQMQAGLTGTNTLRIYNPIKQSYDQDIDGSFIKEWVPELKDVPVNFIHEPWKMSLMEQQMNGLIIGQDYPAPIVEYSTAIKKYKNRLWEIRKSEEAKSESKRILAKHTYSKTKNRKKSA